MADCFSPRNRLVRTWKTLKSVKLVATATLFWLVTLVPAVDAETITTTTNPNTNESRDAVEDQDAAPVDWPVALKNASGRTTYVDKEDDFAKASEVAKPGDVIVVRSGIYRWSTINIKSHGTAAAPIIYTAEHPGGVTFTDGERAMHITGTHNIIGGFILENISARAIELTGEKGPNTGGASDNRITDIKLIGCGKARPYWMVEIGRRSNRNRIDHSVFDENYGYIRLYNDEQDAADYGASQNTRIDHNLFTNTRTDNALHDRTLPVLQIGQEAHPSDRGSDVRLVFEYNTVRNHVTYYEGGLISVKSNNNVIRYNKFIDSHGAIGLRVGNNNKVYGNFIGGAGGGYGIYILGAFNQVYNNIIDAPERVIAISVTRWGNRTCPATPNWCASTPPTHDVLIAHNSILSYADYGIDVGQCDSGACNPLGNVTVANNIIIGHSGTLFRVKSASVNNLTVTRNLYFKLGSAVLGTGYQADNEAILADPGIDSPLHLPSNSPAVRAGRTIPGITTDFHGRPRESSDIGAIEHDRKEID